MTITSTPIALFSHATPSVNGVSVATLAEAMSRVLWARRDAVMRELATIEAELGLGSKDNPTTAQLRDRWRNAG